MDFSQSFYYRENQILLSIFGLWPYSGRSSIMIRKSIALFIMIQGIPTQLSALIVSDFDIIVAFDVLPVLICCVILIILGIYVYGNSHLFDELWKRIREDWASERTKEETEIKENHARIGMLMTKTIIYLFLFGTILYVIVFTFLSEILDFIMPLNETRPHIYPTVDECFIDRQKYFYPLIIRTHIAVLTYIFFGLTNHLLTCVFGLHIYGMFAVLGHRLENAIPGEKLRLTCSEKDLDKIYNRSLIICIQRHKRAIEFANILKTYYSVPFTVSLVAVVLTIIPTLIQFTDLELLRFKSVIQLLLSVSFLFMVNYMGQKLIDLSTEISQKAYNGPWHYCSPKLQKFIVLIIRRCDVPCTISAYDFFVSSLDCFRIMMQTSISYFMAIRKLNEK